jgi:hypothetical protein
MPSSFATAEQITGASIDEAKVEKVLHVTPGTGTYPNLRAAFREAHRLTVMGVAVKIKIGKGIYRESVLGLDWTQGKAGETLLVIEGGPGVVWTGSDVIPLSKWTKRGPLLEAPWKHRFGLFAWSWGPKGVIGHRSEMAFYRGKALRPRILEQYDVTGIEQNPEVQNQVVHTYRKALDPLEVLREGEFGVFEREENRPRIVVRLPKGAVPSEGSLEVSTRQQLLDLDGKSSLVIRGITFQNTANSDREYGHLNAVTFGGHRGRPSNNVLIEDCRWLWNASTGLSIMGDNWTLRRCSFRFNGFSGLATGKGRNVLWEKLDTSFNVWRAWRAGELGYFTGGFKAHELTGHRIKGHLAIGNCTMGAWWDIVCADVFADDLIAIGNAANVQFEISQGPLVGNRWLIAGGKSGEQIRFWEHGDSTLRHCVIYSNYFGSGRSTLYSLRWFGREDQHAKMAPLKAGVNRLEDSILLAGPNVPHFGLIDDIRGGEWSAREPMSYAGRRNFIYQPAQPDFPQNWILDQERTGELAARALPVASWLKSPTYSETETQRIDPLFQNPDSYDFTLSPKSPLWHRRNEWPQFKLSPRDKEAWDWFTRWSGYQPEKWNEPTGD